MEFFEIVTKPPVARKLAVGHLLVRGEFAAKRGDWSRRIK